MSLWFSGFPWCLLLFPPVSFLILLIWIFLSTFYLIWLGVCCNELSGKRHLVVLNSKNTIKLHQATDLTQGVFGGERWRKVGRERGQREKVLAVDKGIQHLCAGRICISQTAAMCHLLDSYWRCVLLSLGYWKWAEGCAFPTFANLISLLKEPTLCLTDFVCLLVCF